MKLKRISEERAAELTDSILISISADGSAEPSAGVLWLAEGNLVSDEGPLSVPAALVLAQTLSSEQKKDTIYVLLPEAVEWQVEWGELDE